MNNITKERNLEELSECKEKVVYYDGLKFVLDEHGYYRCWMNGYVGLRLHRYVWEKQNGEIPKDYHIHHIDGNKSNNHPNNLESLTDSEHGKRHREQFMKVKVQARQSLEWRKQNYESSKHLMHEEVEIECLFCKKKSFKRKYAKYCSKNCCNKYSIKKKKASL